MCTAHSVANAGSLYHTHTHTRHHTRRVPGVTGSTLGVFFQTVPFSPLASDAHMSCCGGTMAAVVPSRYRATIYECYRKASVRAGVRAFLTKTLFSHALNLSPVWSTNNAKAHAKTARRLAACRRSRTSSSVPTTATWPVPAAHPALAPRARADGCTLTSSASR